MYKLIVCSFFSVSMLFCKAQQSESQKLKNELESVIKDSDIYVDSVFNHSFVSENGERFLRLEIFIDAPVAEVWKLISTAEGVKRWMAPVAEVNLKIGGTTKTNYNKTASIGDDGTIILGIINYLPAEMLTYKVKLNNAFPEKCRNEDANLQEIIQLKEINKNLTQVTSTMVGWGEGSEWDKTYSFFEKGNKWTFKQMLISLKDDSGK